MPFDDDNTLWPDNIPSSPVGCNDNTPMRAKRPENRDPSENYEHSPRNIEFSSPYKSDNSIADEIINKRRNDFLKLVEPLSLSPFKCKPAEKHLKGKRDQLREQKTMKNRGGSKMMEKFIMDSERQQELRLLSQQAEQHALPADAIDQLDDQNVKDEDEDEELLRILAQREEYEDLLLQQQQEMQYMLEQFSLS